jgi:hypothetical protein
LTVVLVSRELLFASRIAGAAERLGVDLVRVDDPAGLPAPSNVSLVLVDWAAREPNWGEQLAGWCAQSTVSGAPRAVLFGPHTDLEAHAAARAAGLGPMWARSRLLAELPGLLSRG